MILSVSLLGCDSLVFFSFSRNENLADSVSSCFKDINSAFHSTAVDKTQEAQSTDWSLMKSLERDPQSDGLLNPGAMIIKLDDKCQMSASDLTLEAASLSCQKTATNTLSNSEETSTACTASADMKTFVEKDLQSFTEERNAENVTVCGKDRRPTNAAVSTEGKCMYVSKMELGPLSPTGSSLPHFPCTLQKECKVGAKASVAQMVMLLPRCPQYSVIPGMACLHQSQPRAWPDDKRSLFQKLCSSRPPSLLCHDALGGHFGMTNMVTSALFCTGPGSPSTLNYESKIPLLVSTCPQNSRIPGLPSVECVNRHKRSVWERRSLWKKPFQIEETFGSLLKDHTVTDANMIKIMVTMLPTCPRMAQMPGFPCLCPKKSLNSPSMVCLLPTCPTQTMVAGMPFREKIIISFDSWQILSKWRVNKPLRSNSILVDQYLLPFCQWKSVGLPKGPSFVVSLPLTPHQSPSMVDFVPACPRKSRVLGLPSKEFLSYQNKNMDTSLIEGHLNRGSDLSQGSSKGALDDSDKREMSNMVAMLPSCPIRTCLVGLPSCPQKRLFNPIQVSTCCKEAHVPDTGSQIVSNLTDWQAFPQLTKRPDKTTKAFIHPLNLKDMEILSGMIHMASGCPNKTNIFGLPSAPRQEACMVNLMPSCSRCSEICGLPSKVAQPPVTCKYWFACTKVHWMSPFIKRGVQIHNAVSMLDKSTIQMMTATRPSCPIIAGVPGFPSILMFTDGPKMVNLSHCYTKDSRVPGMSLGCSTKEIQWTIERKSLLLPQKKATFHFLDVLCCDLDVTLNMISMLSSCPNVACFPGFPSVSCQTLVAIPNIISLLPTCSRHSVVCGIPSRLRNGPDECEWIGDEKPLCGKPLSLPAGLSSIQRIHHREKGLVTIMLSMLPSCPKHSNITGIPSKIKERSVQTYNMFRSLQTTPKYSQILGFPAKNTAKGSWYFGQNVVGAKPLVVRYTAIHTTGVFMDLSAQDKRNMWRILPSCAQQVLTTGYPVFPKPPPPETADGSEEKHTDMIKLHCSRCSGIIGFPSRTFVNSSFYPGCSLVLPITKQHRSSHQDAMLGIQYHEPCSANSALSVDLASMVNIEPCCPRRGFVLGVTSKHVHCSEQGWPGGDTLLLGASKTNVLGNERGMDQHLAQQEDLFHQMSVLERSVEDASVDVQQRRASPVFPLGTSGQDSPLSSSEVQVDQTSPSLTCTKIYKEVSQKVLDTDRKNTCSSQEMLNTGFWMSRENEDEAAIEHG